MAHDGTIEYTNFKAQDVDYTYTCHLCEIFVILAREFASLLSDRVLATLVSDPSVEDQLKLSPLFVLGIFLLVLGAATRQLCYGNFINFQLAVFKEHRLVASGPILHRPPPIIQRVLHNPNWALRRAWDIWILIIVFEIRVV
ncbi:hypothetical protein V8D89_004145 [Ganoderma adspersum]